MLRRQWQLLRARAALLVRVKERAVTLRHAVRGRSRTQKAGVARGAHEQLG